MTIIQDERFRVELKAILAFIAKDKISAAKKFNLTVQNKMNGLLNSPRKYKKLQPLDNDNIRVLIVDGYSIPYFIDDIQENIIILGIFKSNLWRP
ncbi:MAG: type II toxin-antitoxin system RelE/ParE family toxin [Campylobacterales bacterium]|nr:type II toxin-antitoxin system RelE/ParE family toxin [Campylobacterales bacterium]